MEQNVVASGNSCDLSTSATHTSLRDWVRPAKSSHSASLQNSKRRWNCQHTGSTGTQKKCFRSGFSALVSCCYQLLNVSIGNSRWVREFQTGERNVIICPCSNKASGILCWSYWTLTFISWTACQREEGLQSADDQSVSPWEDKPALQAISLLWTGTGKTSPMKMYQKSGKLTKFELWIQKHSCFEVW